MRMVSVYVCMCVCMHVYIYIYIYIYIYKSHYIIYSSKVLPTAIMHGEIYFELNSCTECI